jgi:dihydroorotate dehydrogenase
MLDGAYDQTTGLWRLLRPLAFRLDPERAHDLTLGLLERWSALFDGTLGDNDIARAPRLAVEAMGLRFPNPIGLAAGLDKNAVAVPAWQALGFGFIEVGTITALAQPGNPKPRLFRLPPDEALINRMGFNNGGADAAARRLERLRARGVLQVPLGVNLGKSKVTPAEEAADDYRRSFERSVTSPIMWSSTSQARTRRACAISSGSTRSRVSSSDPGPQPASRPTPPDPRQARPGPRRRGRRRLRPRSTGRRLRRFGPHQYEHPLRRSRQHDRGMSGGLSGRPILSRSTELLSLIRQAVGPEPRPGRRRRHHGSRRRRRQARRRGQSDPDLYRADLSGTRIRASAVAGARPITPEGTRLAEHPIESARHDSDHGALLPFRMPRSCCKYPISRL